MKKATYVHTQTHKSWYLINESSNDYIILGLLSQPRRREPFATCCFYSHRLPPRNFNSNKSQLGSLISAHSVQEKQSRLFGSLYFRLISAHEKYIIILWVDMNLAWEEHQTCGEIAGKQSFQIT